MTYIYRALGLACVLAAAPVTPSGAQVGEACPGEQLEVGTIGIGELECRNCRVGTEFEVANGIGRRYWDFRSEPMIGGVVAGSPAAGQLRAGDVITAIDGYLITTREGGVRFGALVPGQPVTLRIRRGEREFEFTLTPVSECRRATVRPVEPAAVPTPAEPAELPTPAVPATVPSQAVPPRPPTARAAPRPGRGPTLPRVPRPAPRAWPSTSALGFSIQCSDCSLQRRADPQGWIWSFSKPPVVERVEPGSPARRAGLQAGDVLTHIDGQPLTAAEGGRRFGAVEAGDRITFTYRRGTDERTAVLVARGAVGWGAEVAPEPAVPALSAQPEITRFSGSIGDAVIQVTGGRVTVTRTDDEIVIRSSDITVRIRRR